MTFEIVPLPQTKDLAKLPKFAEVQKKMAALYTELDKLQAESRDLRVTDDASYKRGAAIVARRKQIVKDAEDLCAPYKSPLRKWLDFVQQHFNIIKNAAEMNKGVLDTKLSDFLKRDAKAVEAEQARAQQEHQEQLERDAEVKRRADEAAAGDRRKARVAEIRQLVKEKKITLAESKKLLEEAGAKEEAEKVRAKLQEEEAKTNAATEAAKTVVESSVPTVGGVRKTLRRTFVIRNPQQVKLKYLTPDEKKIGEIVRNMDLTVEQIVAEVGGIEISEDYGF